MFEGFVDRFVEELGPLNPAWFEELTAKAAANNGVFDVLNPEEEDDEDTVKASPDKASQLCSTPKIFQQHYQSPASIQSQGALDPVTHGNSSVFPWIESSPCLFGSAKDRFHGACEDVKNSTGIVEATRCPQEHSPVGQFHNCFGLSNTPKRSLGHSIKPISESLGAQVSPDISWTSSFNTPSSLTPTVLLSKTEDGDLSKNFFKDRESVFVRNLFPSLSKGPVNPSALCDSAVKQNDSLLDNRCQWKQKPENGDVCSTVENVLEGAEDVLSIFFSSSSSALRRVKTKEKIRRRIKGSGTSPQTIVPALVPINTNPEVKSPCKTADFIQWTPLSLSDSGLNEETKSGDAVISVKANKYGSGLNLHSDEKGLVFQTSTADETFLSVKKPRRFVYQMASLDLTKPVTEDKEAPAVCLEQTLAADKPSDGKECCPHMESKYLSQDAEDPETTGVQHISMEIHDHGLNMTQLSKVFAEDFTQELVPHLHTDVQKDSITADFEQRNQEDSSALAEVSVNSLTKLALDISRDSGCPTTISDVDQFSGFKTASNRSVSIPTAALNRARAFLDESVDVTFSNSEKHHLNVSERSTKPMLKQNLSLKPAVSSRRFKTNLPTCYSTPQLPESVNNSDSKANIASSDVLMNEKTLNDSRNTEKGDSCQNTSMICSLTESQKADVTELCSMLEEANSQYEFTQFRPTIQTSDQAWEPAVDREDCLSYYALKVKQQIKTGTSIANISELATKEKDDTLVQTAKDVCYTLKDNLPVNEDSFSDGIKKREEEKSSLGDQPHSMGFKTATGKAIRISASSLNKAMRFFEEDLDEKPDAVETKAGQSKKHRNYPSAITIMTENEKFSSVKHQRHFRCGEFEPLSLDSKSSVDLANFGHFGFSTAKGEKLNVSERAILHARKLFEDVDASEEAQDEGSSCVPSTRPQELNLVCSHVSCVNPSVTSIANYQTTEKHQNDSITKSKLQDQTDKICPPEEVSLHNIGFQKANGKAVSVSSTALHRAMTLLKDCESELHTKKSLLKTSSKISEVAPQSLSSDLGLLKEVELHQLNDSPCKKTSKVHSAYLSSSSPSGSEKVSISADALQKANDPTERQSRQVMSESCLSNRLKGFSTASGSKVTMSASALRRAKSLFEDFEDGFASEQHQSDKIPSQDFGFQRTTKCRKNDTLSKKNYGFSTAGNKTLSVSAKPLQKAKDLLSERIADIEKETSSSPLGKGFSTVACDESPVSPPLLGAISLLKDCEVGGSTSEQQKLEMKQPEDLSCCRTEEDDRPGRSACGFSTARGKGVSVSKAVLEKVSRLFQDVQPGISSMMLDGVESTAHLLSSNTSQKESAHLDLRSEFRGCSDTQQRFFEQEAAACTEALLADEHLNEPAATYESKRLNHRNSVEQRGGRRDRLDACGDEAHPLLKRKLLAEFDQTLDAKCLAGISKKSCQNGILQERRVFKYIVRHQTAASCLDFSSLSKDSERSCTNVSVQNRSPEQGAIPFVKTFPFPPFKENNQDETTHNNMDQTILTAAGQCVSLPEAADLNTQSWLDVLQLARDMQDMRLLKKKKQTIRPVPGRVYLAKTSDVSRMSLRDAVANNCPKKYSLEELYRHTVHPCASQITSENAEAFRFDLGLFCQHDLLKESGAVQLADGGWLVPDQHGTVGKEEFYRALCDTRGVDPGLISDIWVFNHYRWIVWKRASMERTFPEVFGGLCLSPEQVLLQLKFRYDMEVDHCKRSAVRRIVERDDTPAKTLVLCICGVVPTIHNPETAEEKMSSMVVWLTDGWYSIRALLDPPLSATLKNGRLKVGEKIMVSGAELIGSQEACSPLEAPESLMLKIHTNSTRRARWDIKLGYFSDPRPIRLPLSSLCADGGLVSCVDVLLLRSYPTQWMEKKSNGVFVFRNERAEEREARKHSNSKQKALELVFADVQSLFEKELEVEKRAVCQKRTYSRQEVETLQEEAELYEALQCDPSVETHLSESQLETVSQFRVRVMEQRQLELQERMQKAVMEADGDCSERDVTPVWKLAISDASDLQSHCVYTLNIWRPSASLYNTLREGSRFLLYHLSASASRKGIVGLQLTTTKRTLFKNMEVSPEWSRLNFRARECFNFQTLQNPDFSSPYGEVDIVGCVVAVSGKRDHCPVLHLVDEKLDLVSVKTSISLEHLALEDVVRPQSLLAFSNLQPRPSFGPVPSLYAGEQTLFSTNPRDLYLQRALARLKTAVQSCGHFFTTAEEKLSMVLDVSQPPRIPAVPTTPKLNSKVTPQHRICTTFITPLNWKMPLAVNPEDSEPRSVKRRRGLDYLSRIPSPPHLTPLKTRASPSLHKTFNPPRRSVTPNQAQTSSLSLPGEEWVPDEDMVMIDTQALLHNLGDESENILHKSAGNQALVKPS